MTIPYQHIAEGVTTPIDRIRKRGAGCGVLMLEGRAATSAIQRHAPEGDHSMAGDVDPSGFWCEAAEQAAMAWIARAEARRRIDEPC